MGGYWKDFGLCRWEADTLLVFKECKDVHGWK